MSDDRFSASNNVSTNIWLELNDRAYGFAWIDLPKSFIYLHLVCSWRVQQMGYKSKV